MSNKEHACGEVNKDHGFKSWMQLRSWKIFLGLYYAGILQGSAFFVNSAQYKAFVGVEKTRLQVCSRSSSLHERGMVGV